VLLQLNRKFEAIRQCPQFRPTQIWVTWFACSVLLLDKFPSRKR